jgi:hypothetical protein
MNYAKQVGALSHTHSSEHRITSGGTNCEALTPSREWVRPLVRNLLVGSILHHWNDCDAVMRRVRLVEAARK